MAKVNIEEDDLFEFLLGTLYLADGPEDEDEDPLDDEDEPEKDEDDWGDVPEDE